MDDALLLVLGMDIAGMPPKLKIPNLIDFVVLYVFMSMHIGVSRSFFRGVSQQLHPAKIKSLPAKTSSCQEGP